MFERGGGGWRGVIWLFHARVLESSGPRRDNGVGEAEKYLRLLSALVHHDEKMPSFFFDPHNGGHITSIMPRHVCQRATLGYRAI